MNSLNQTGYRLFSCLPSTNVTLSYDDNRGFGPMNNHREGVVKWILSWVTGTYMGASQLGMRGAMPIYDVDII